ncbi:MAG: C4-type zinc ribbon domain-containing protein [Elusimicrobiota bacterium]|jgi:hypothetical protein
MAFNKDDVAKLVGLQEQDRVLDALRAEIDAIPGQIAALQNEADAEKRALAEAKDHVVKSVLKRKEKEQQLAAKEAEARKFGNDLNNVKTNEAFRALQHEIDGCKKQAGDIETEILMLMEEGDALSKEEKVRAASLKEAEGRVQQKVGLLEARKAEIEGKLAARKGERDGFAGTIAPEMVAQYDAIRVRRKGIALSKLDGNTCGACRMVQPPQVMVYVAKAAKLVCCESCQRILYSADQVFGPKPA